MAECSKASGKEPMFVPISIHTMHENFGVSYEILDAPAYFTDYGFADRIDGIVEPHRLKRKVQTKPFENW